MVIRVEFFGIPRQRAGVGTVDLAIESPKVTVQEILQRLEARYPKLGNQCIDNGMLTGTYILNVQGEQFVRDADHLVRDGTTILFMSADVGG